MVRGEFSNQMDGMTKTSKCAYAGCQFLWRKPPVQDNALIAPSQGSHLFFVLPIVETSKHVQFGSVAREETKRFKQHMDTFMVDNRTNIAEPDLTVRVFRSTRLSTCHAVSVRRIAAFLLRKTPFPVLFKQEARRTKE